MTMLSADKPLEVPRTSLHGLGVKKVKLAIDYDSEEKKLKRTVTITTDVSAEEAAQVDHLTKLNATFIVDLHVEGYQRELISDGPTPPGHIVEHQPDKDELDPTDDRPGVELDKAAQTAKEEVASAPPSDDGKAPKRVKVGTATKIGNGPPGDGDLVS